MRAAVSPKQELAERLFDAPCALRQRQSEVEFAALMLYIREVGQQIGDIGRLCAICFLHQTQCGPRSIRRRVKSTRRLQVPALLLQFERSLLTH